MMENTPPRWADWLLETFVDPHLREDLQGDLHEVFYKQVEKMGLAKARWAYAWAVLHYINPVFFGRKQPAQYYSPSLLHPAMIRNYLKVAWRNLRKHSAYSALNIFGLSLGLTSCLLMTLYVVDELSYDRFHQHADRIYRVDTYAKFGGTVQDLAETPDPIGPTLKKDYPQVEEYVRFFKADGSRLVRKGKEFIEEAHTIYADSTLFNVFTLPVLAGNPQTALRQPNSVVITESTAKKYFGRPNVLGQLIEVDKSVYTVSAVIRDIPHNSHFHADFIFPMSGLDYGWGNFLTTNFHTYILLRAGVDHTVFNRQLMQVIKKYIYPQAKDILHLNSPDDFNRGDTRFEMTLFPLTDIHLRSDRRAELEPNGNSQFVYIFSAVALFVLLIACVNFMNLSTARSSGRAKEVGIRKALGTNRKSLMGQFLTESTLMVTLALLIALGMTKLVTPLFNDLSAKELGVTTLFSFPILPFLLAIPLLVGLLAGSYPAFLLSAFQPVAVLKGELGSRIKTSTFRSALVVFQFVSSVILVIGTIIVYRQLAYIQTKNVGFTKDQVLIIDGTQVLGDQIEPFKRELLKLPGVTAGTVSGFLPISPALRNGQTFAKQADLSPATMFDTQSWIVDADYMKTMGMKILKGRNFSATPNSDDRGLIINESLAKLLGYRDPVGHPLYTGDRSQPPYTIIGVVKDFNYESLRQRISPLCFQRGTNADRVALRVTATATRPVLGQIEAIWKAMAPEAQFRYRFMDQAFDSMYRSEQRIGRIALTFACLAILIACLGLFGLAAYMAEQRTREIGVRKVLGATSGDIVSMLSGSFLRLVLVAILIACPIGYYCMELWLQNFAYRIDIEWWVFIVSGLVAVGIALLTISFQSIKAALMNPVKSLRSE
ncbi:ABC transporter permease [Spirosoma koreense]